MLDSQSQHLFEGFRLEDFSNRADVANAALKRTRGKAKKAVGNTV
jgi:hypothetical protein